MGQGDENDGEDPGMMARWVFPLKRTRGFSA